MNKKVALTIPVIIIVVIAVIVVFVVGFLSNSLFSWLNPFKPLTGSSYSSATVLTGLKPLGELTTIEVQLAKANIEVQTNWGIGNICRVSARHTAQGSIRAGIDLNQVTEESITYDQAANRLTVTLPPASLSSCSLDPMEIIQYDRQGATVVCQFDYDELRLISSYISLREFRDDAIESGILTRAEQQAKIAVETFIRALFANMPEMRETQVNVEFASGNAPFPESCMPDLPAGWQYNEADGLWSQVQ